MIRTKEEIIEQLESIRKQVESIADDIGADNFPSNEQVLLAYYKIGYVAKYLDEAIEVLKRD